MEFENFINDPIYFSPSRVYGVKMHLYLKIILMIYVIRNEEIKLMRIFDIIEIFLEKIFVNIKHLSDYLNVQLMRKINA